MRIDAAPEPLAFTDVTKRLGGRPVLAGVAFTCPPGRVTTLLGPNGAGKTTAVTLAAGLRRPTTGTVRTFGADCASPPARRTSAIVAQEIGFPATVRVSELLDFITVQRAPSRIAPPTAELCAALGLTDLLARQIGGLSGGQRRRVAVALGLVRAPGLLILDEATSNLDHEGRQVVWQLVRDYAGRGGTVLATTHILSDAEAVADHVVVLSDGCVLRSGPADEIRALVGGRQITVRVRPDLVDGLAADLSAAGLGPARASDTPGEIRLVTEHAEHAVRLLLARDPHATGLEVTTPSLAEALDGLLQAGPIGSAPVTRGATGDRVRSGWQ